MSQSSEQSSNIYEKLVDFICDLYKKETPLDSNVLFTKACENLGIEIMSFCKEDINYIGLYSCQVILNSDIYLEAVSGNSKNQAYENVIRKFINLCLKKKDILYKYSENIPESFYLELSQSIKTIDLSNTIRDKVKTFLNNELKLGHLSTVNIINYENAKNNLKKDNLLLTESFCGRKDGTVVCSIMVNDLLLQQNSGNDEKEALKNTVDEFFNAYGMLPKNNQTGASNCNGDVGVAEILRQMGKLFREKKNKVEGDLRYWDIIYDCARSLNYDLQVKCGKVKINNITLINIEENNEYVGSIKACKELVKILSTERVKATSYSANHSWKNQPIQNTIMNFPKMTKIYNENERQEIMSKIALGTNNEFLKDQRQTIWNVLNRQFLKESCKVDPRYRSTNGGFECTLVFQEYDLATAFNINKYESRESAANALLKKYLPAQSV